MTENQKEPEKRWRGFDDEYKTYFIGDVTIPAPSVGFNDTENLEKISDEYNEAVHKFNKKEITGNDLNKAKTKFIKESLKIMLTPDDYELLLSKFSKPTLFGVAKDFHAFLQVIGSTEELQLLLTQSKQMLQMNSESTETS